MGEWFVIAGVFVEVLLAVHSSSAEWVRWQEENNNQKKTEQIASDLQKTHSEVTNLPAKIIEAEKNRFNGELIPSNKPFPDPDLEAPLNSVVLFLGNAKSVVYSFPHCILLAGGRPVLTISENTNGATVSADFFDKNGNIVASLQNNKFHINPLNAFNIERPDSSSLIVRDQQNITVLDVRFLNPQAIMLNGVLRTPNGREIIISTNLGPFSSSITTRGNMIDFMLP